MSTNSISPEAIAELFADLKALTQPGGSMEGDHFRYESFARRLVAAEYGRPDAVAWALEWHTTLLADRHVKDVAQNKRAIEAQALLQHARAELAAGRSTNSMYQAFLDTVEDPTLLVNNVDYMVFVNLRSAEFAKLKLAPKPPVTDEAKRFAVLQYGREYAEAHLSERVKAARAAEQVVKKPKSVSPSM